MIEDLLVPEPLSTNSAYDSMFFPISRLASVAPQRINPDFTINPNLQMMTIGKQLLLDDLPFSIEDIQAHYVNGSILYRKGIDYERKRPHCVRCGNQDLTWFSEFPCARC